MHRSLAALLAATACASIAQAQTGPLAEARPAQQQSRSPASSRARSTVKADPVSAGDLLCCCAGLASASGPV
jgi:hypothetical protein